MAYRVFGTGPAVVFVHGWPFSGSSFRSLVARLKQHFTCYVPDLPGAGETPWDPSIRDLFVEGGERVAAFVRALELPRVALVGFDSGGALARVAAAELGCRVFALALTNTETPGHRLPLIEAFQKIARLPGSALAFRFLLHARWFVESKYGFGSAVARLSHLDGDFAAATLEPLKRDASGALTALCNADLNVGEHLAEIHARIDAPLLCVWGDRCGFFPLPHAETMVQDWRGPAALEVVEGERLLVHEEAPDAVVHAMLPFLLHHAAVQLRKADAG
jgi:pimeloyl-ACP methyl ester carboxylesterase